ncbi:MAG: hypothetical protein WKG00_36420 [Polyangiaceae bacterium]
MPLYELSADPPRLREAERVVSLEGRGYPTLVMQWQSRLFGQLWTTSVVLDYLIALPPLTLGEATFNDVRVAAFVGGAPTKFLYFGTEMSASAPRIAPDMENVASPASLYQEFRLEERTCPIPYLKLIQATPRIFGNGPQDYYSPPIKVERYDAVAGIGLLEDRFPALVAGLPPVAGDVLVDPARGFWTGARFVGPAALAILRQGVVVGLCQRSGKDAKEPLPPDIKKRDPKLDLSRQWVAVDLGARSTVVAVGGERGAPELLRVGAAGAPQHARDFENPSEVFFEHVGRTLKAWRERVVLPASRWDDVRVAHAARTARLPPPEARPEAARDRDSSRPPPPVAGPDPRRAAASLRELPWVRERIERKAPLRLCGLPDPETSEALKKPAPPVIDEDGIGANDPFDPLELYAYYLALHVNQRARGLFMRWAVTMPTGWPAARRESALCAFRRGIFRSLPAGLVPYEDVDHLRVLDAGPAALCFAAHAFRVFGVSAGAQSTPFVAIDAGASETAVVAGVARAATAAENGNLGHERVLEHLPPVSVPWLGGERLLGRLACRVWVEHPAARELCIPIEPPAGDPAEARGAGLDPEDPMVQPSVEARSNAGVLRDALRPVLEGGSNPSTRLPAVVRLLDAGGKPVDLVLTLDRQVLTEAVGAWLAEGAAAVRQAIGQALAKLGKQPDPYEGLRIFVGGRLGMSAAFVEALGRDLPSSARLHRFVEPDRTNPGAPTAKTTTALGALLMRVEKVGAVPRSEERDAFRHRVGRARHGQLSAVLEPGVDYDAWRELGACSRPEVDVLFMVADADDEVAADDPRVKKASCSFGEDAVGKRVYLRAVSPVRVEVTVGPPGGDPDEDAPRWTVDLVTGTAQR